MTTLEPGVGIGQLGDRIWRRYGAAPGLIKIAPALQLMRRVGRFAAGRLLMLESIQRRFGALDLSAFGEGRSARAGWPGSGVGELLYPPPLPGSGAGAIQGAPGAGRLAAGLQTAPIARPALPGLQAPSPAQAKFDFPLTARAVRAKTAGRDALALTGDIVERHTSRPAARALQRAPENVRVQPEPAGERATTVQPAAVQIEPRTGSGAANVTGRLAASVEQLQRGNPQAGAPATSSAETRPASASAQPLPERPDASPGEGVVGRSPDVGGPLPKMGDPGRELTSGPQPTTPPAPALPLVQATSHSQIARSAVGERELAGEGSRSPGGLPVVAAHPAGPLDPVSMQEAGGGQVQRRTSASLSPGAGQGRVGGRKAAVPITQSTPPAGAEAVGVGRPPASGAGQPAGTAGRARGSRAGAGALGAAIVRRSLGMSTAQRAQAAGLPLAAAAAVTLAAGRALIHRALAAAAKVAPGPAASGPPAGPGSAPEAGARAASSVTVGRSSPGASGLRAGSAAPAGPVVQATGRATSGRGIRQAPAGGPDLLHARPEAQAGAAETGDAGAPRALPTGSPAPAGSSSAVPPSAGRAAPPNAGSDVSAGGGQLLLARSLDQAASPPDMPDVQRTALAQQAAPAARAGSAAGPPAGGSELPVAHSVDQAAADRPDMPDVQRTPVAQPDARATQAGEGPAGGGELPVARSGDPAAADRPEMPDVQRSTVVQPKARAVEAAAAGPPAGGDELPVARSVDQAADRPEMPDVQRMPVASPAVGANQAVAGEGQRTSALGELPSAGAHGPPVAAILRTQAAGAVIGRKAENLPMVGPSASPRGAPGLSIAQGVPRGAVRSAAEAAMTSRTIMRLPVVRTASAGLAAGPAEFSDAGVPLVRAAGTPPAFSAAPVPDGAATSGGTSVASTPGGLRGGMSPSPLPHLQLRAALAAGEAVAQPARAAADGGTQTMVGRPGGPLGNGPASVLLQRAGEAAPGAPAAPPAPAPSAAGASGGNGPGMDLPRLADQVYELIRRRLIRERERKGLPPQDW